MAESRYRNQPDLDNIGEIPPNTRTRPPAQHQRVEIVMPVMPQAIKTAAGLVCELLALVVRVLELACELVALVLALSIPPYHGLVAFVTVYVVIFWVSPTVCRLFFGFGFFWLQLRKPNQGGDTRHPSPPHFTHQSTHRCIVNTYFLTATQFDDFSQCITRGISP